ncbi:MAG: hypothetical protein JSS86_02520 [Cyanobacteria bacterium SZAS LIN-2]|nr:hypothetical protein [Cyanobacteria bacterium SZAS LIN-2]
MRLTSFVLANLVLAQVGLAGVCTTAGTAQAPQASTTRPMYKPGARKAAPRESMRKILQTMPPNIPVPIPPDAKFVTGYQSQYAGAKAMTYVRMYTENQPATLIDWYRKNLQAYNWTFKERPGAKPTNLPSLSGTKGTVTCTINFEGPIGRLGKTTALMITFNEAR